MVFILYRQCSQYESIETFGYVTSKSIADGWVRDGKKKNPSWSFWYTTVYPYSGK